jgi:hypothetical protein
MTETRSILNCVNLQSLISVTPVSATTNTPDLVFESEAKKIESELHGNMQRANDDMAPPAAR